MKENQDMKKNQEERIEVNLEGERQAFISRKAIEQRVIIIIPSEILSKDEKRVDNNTQLEAK